MPASSSFLRLLALGAFADIAEAFATLRKGMGVVEEIGTESAGGFSGCMCGSTWYCNVDGPNSLENPPSDYGEVLLAGYINYCWNTCYKNPGYMSDGSSAIMWNLGCSKPLRNGSPVDGDPSEIWRTGMCRLNKNGAGTYTRNLMGPNSPPNPFKDSCEQGWRLARKGECVVNGTRGTDPYTTTFKGESYDIPGYTTFLCQNLFEQNTPDALADKRSVEERCKQVVQPDSAEIKGTFQAGMIQMRSDSRFGITGESAGLTGTALDAYICPRLYKYWELEGNRMYIRATYDRVSGKCKQYIMAEGDTNNPTNTRAQECKKMLCGYKQLDQCREGGLNQYDSPFQCFVKSGGSATGKNTESHQGAKSLDFGSDPPTYSVNYDPATGKCRKDCGDPDDDCDSILDGTYSDPCPGACQVQ